MSTPDSDFYNSLARGDLGFHDYAAHVYAVATDITASGLAPSSSTRGPADDVAFNARPIWWQLNWRHRDLSSGLARDSQISPRSSPYTSLIDRFAWLSLSRHRADPLSTAIPASPDPGPPPRIPAGAPAGSVPPRPPTM